jgi:hypothetical protein
VAGSREPPRGRSCAGNRGIGSEAVLGLTVVSVVVGLALAVAYHLAALRVQRFALRRNTIAGPAFVILGFLARLVVIAAILLLIGFFAPLNIIAVCLAFVVIYSVLNLWSVYALMSKGRKVPPSAGATGL